MATIVCPIDNKGDAIQKVRDIWQDDYEWVEGTSFPNLAGKVGPPDDPTDKPKERRAVKVTFAILIIVGICFYALIPIVDYIIDESLVSNSWYAQGRTYAGIVGIAYLLCLVLVGLFLQMDKVRYQQDEANYVIKRRQFDNAMKRWDRLCFCHKHGIVFDPDTNETCELAGSRNFINQAPKF